jgi:hypothetical protein
MAAITPAIAAMAASTNIDHPSREPRRAGRLEAARVGAGVLLHSSQLRAGLFLYLPRFVDPGAEPSFSEAL